MADPLDALHPLREPQLSLLEIAAEGAAAAAAALAIGLALALLLRLIAPRAKTRAARARAALSASRDLPAPARLAAQARLLDGFLGPDAPRDWPARAARLDQLLRTDFFTKGQGAELPAALYRPETNLDPNALDARLDRLFARARV